VPMKKIDFFLWLTQPVSKTARIDERTGSTVLV
jgi:hypothetical protein